LNDVDIKPWLVVLHILSVFGFLAVHGISMGVVFRVRKERDRGRLTTLLEFSTTYLTAMYLFLLLLLVSGVAAGIVGGRWTNGELWLWVSLGLLIALVVAMYYFMTEPFAAMRSGLGIQGMQDKKKGIMPTPASDAELAVLLTARRPVTGAALGVGTIVVITWLMEMKPF
jgi:hypothetical protein